MFSPHAGGPIRLPAFLSASGPLLHKKIYQVFHNSCGHFLAMGRRSPSSLARVSSPRLHISFGPGTYCKPPILSVCDRPCTTDPSHAPLRSTPGVLDPPFLSLPDVRLHILLSAHPGPALFHYVCRFSLSRSLPPPPCRFQEGKTEALLRPPSGRSSARYRKK